MQRRVAGVAVVRDRSRHIHISTAPSKQLLERRGPQARTRLLAYLREREGVVIGQCHAARRLERCRPQRADGDSSANMSPPESPRPILRPLTRKGRRFEGWADRNVIYGNHRTARKSPRRRREPSYARWWNHEETARSSPGDVRRSRKPPRVGANRSHRLRSSSTCVSRRSTRGLLRSRGEVDGVQHLGCGEILGCPRWIAPRVEVRADDVRVAERGLQSALVGVGL
jgi:hypothetical protein